MTRRRILLGRLAGVCAAAFCAFVAARADDVYLLRNDGKIDNVDVRSFEAAGNWSNGEAPSDAHDYYVMTNYSLRVTGSTAAHVFKGNSLTLGGTGSGNNFKGQIMGWEDRPTSQSPTWSCTRPRSSATTKGGST